MSGNNDDGNKPGQIPEHWSDELCNKNNNLVSSSQQQQYQPELPEHTHQQQQSRRSNHDQKVPDMACGLLVDQPYHRQSEHDSGENGLPTLFTKSSAKSGCNSSSSTAQRFVPIPDAPIIPPSNREQDSDECAQKQQHHHRPIQFESPQQRRQRPKLLNDDESHSEALHFLPNTLTAENSFSQPFMKHNAPVIMTLTAFPFRVVMANDAAECMFGKSCSSKSIFSLFVQDHPNQPNLTTHPTLLGRVQEGDVVKVRCGDGTFCFSKIKILPIQRPHDVVAVHPFAAKNGEKDTDERKTAAVGATAKNGPVVAGYAVFLDRLGIPPHLQSSVVYRSFP